MRYPNSPPPWEDRPQPPDRDGLAAKDIHVRFNAWEHGQLQKLARRDCASMQRTVRMLVRKRLLELEGGA